MTLFFFLSDFYTQKKIPYCNILKKISSTILKRNDDNRLLVLLLI